MRATDDVNAHLAQAEVGHLTRLDQPLDGAGGLLDGDAGVEAVLVQQVDPLDAESLQGAVDDLNRTGSDGDSRYLIPTSCVRSVWPA